MSCPLLVIQGDDDQLIPPDRGAAFAELTGAELVELRGRRPLPARPPPGPLQPARCATSPSASTGAGARPPPGAARCSGRKRALLRLLADRPRPRVARRRDRARAARAASRTWRSTGSRRTRSRACSRRCGERIHPASAQLANESRHIAAESREHELNVFQAWRRMDEILLANFMVFRRRRARPRPYDLWIGDEAWELDYYLHENPELKTRAVRVPDRLRRLAADARGRRRRGAPDGRLQRRDDRADRALPARARPRDLRRRRPPTSCRTTSATACPRSARGSRSTSTSRGYVLAPDAGVPADRDALRAELGYGPDERVCLVTVGGSGVGGGLLRRVIDAFPGARAARPRAADDRRLRPADRPGVAAGAGRRRARRLRPRPLAPPRRVRRRGHAGRPDDVHGAGGRQAPFLYVPLQRHFEQNLHVRHRLERYGAGRAIDLADRRRRRRSPPRSPARWRRSRAAADVERDGAARAARLIADLL